MPTQQEAEHEIPDFKEWLADHCPDPPVDETEPDDRDDETDEVPSGWETADWFGHHLAEYLEAIQTYPHLAPTDMAHQLVWVEPAKLAEAKEANRLHKVVAFSRNLLTNCKQLVAESNYSKL